MKNPLANKQFIYIILAILMIGGLFYWYEWRPSNIRQDCMNRFKKIEMKISSIDIYKDIYTLCLHQNGL